MSRVHHIFGGQQGNAWFIEVSSAVGSEKKERGRVNIFEIFRFVVCVVFLRCSKHQTSDNCGFHDFLRRTFTSFACFPVRLSSVMSRQTLFKQTHTHTKLWCQNLFRLLSSIFTFETGVSPGRNRGLSKVGGQVFLGKLGKKLSPPLLWCEIQKHAIHFYHAVFICMYFCYQEKFHNNYLPEKFDIFGTFTLELLHQKSLV